MREKKKYRSWDYQKGRYKQLNIKFDTQNYDDAILYHYVTTRTDNTTGLIKRLIYEEMVRSAYYE